MHREGFTLPGQDAAVSNDGLDRLLKDLTVFPLTDGPAPLELMVGVSDTCSQGSLRLGAVTTARVDGLIVAVLGLGGMRPDVRDVRLLLDGGETAEPHEVAELLDGLEVPDGDEAALAQALATLAMVRLGARGAVAVLGFGGDLIAGSAGTLEPLAAVALQAMGAPKVHVVWNEPTSAVA